MKNQKKGWLVVNRTLRKKFEEHVEAFKKSFEAEGIALEDVDNDELIYEISGGHRYVFEEEARPDFALFWDKDIRLAYNLECEIPVFNAARCIEICDDKALMHHYAALAGVDTPKTIFSPKYYKEGDIPPRAFIDLVTDRLKMPLIIKEACGSFGEGVYLARDRVEIYEIIKKISGKPYIFQEFIKESEGRDIRAYVCGGYVVGAALRENKCGDFRANVCNGSVMTPYELTKEQEAFALKAAAAVGALFAGVDILFGAAGPLLCEVNSNAHFINFLKATDIDFSRDIAQAVDQLTDGGKKGE